RTTRRCRFCGYWHGVPTPLGAVRPGHSSPGRCCRPGRCWGWRRLRSVRTRRVSVGSFGNSTHRTENGYRLRPHGPHLWTVSAGAGGLTLAVVGAPVPILLAGEPGTGGVLFRGRFLGAALPPFDLGAGCPPVTPVGLGGRVGGGRSLGAVDVLGQVALSRAPGG